MAYIGREPQIGNFQVCDAISVVNGQAAYTMQVSSVNVSPETANHMIVSLNGVLQAPGSSYTVSGSTITFASNLVTGDVIDFIHILGSVLDLGVPSDDTVATSSLKANSVTAAKFNADVISGQTALASEPADTDEFLVSDAGVLKRIDYSLIKGGGSHTLLSTSTVTSGVSEIDITSNIDSTYKKYMVDIINLHPATDEAQLRFRVFIGGSIYTASNYEFGNQGKSSNGDNLSDQNSGTDHYFLGCDGLGNAAAESFSGRLFLYNPAETTFNKIVNLDSGHSNSSNNTSHATGTCMIKNTAAYTGIRLYMSSGNIDAAIVKLYGVT
jgi:hypothetical protein